MSYQILEETFYRLAQLNHAGAILGWDQQVMMPPKGNEARGRAMAELQVLSSDIMQDPKLLEATAADRDPSGVAGLRRWQFGLLGPLLEQL